MSDIGSGDEGSVRRPSLHGDNKNKGIIHSDPSSDIIECSTPQASHQRADTSCGDKIDLESNSIGSEEVFTSEVGIPIQRKSFSHTVDITQHTSSEVRPNKSTSDTITPGSTPVESSLKRLKPINDEEFRSIDSNNEIVCGDKLVRPEQFNIKDCTSDYTDIGENQESNNPSTSALRPSSDDNNFIDAVDNNDGDGESDYVTIGSSDEDDDLSDVSSLSGINWKPQPVTGLNNWVHRRMCDGSSPREILNHMLPNSQIPGHLDDVFLWQIIFNLLNEPPCRKKLTNYNTIDDAVNLIKNSKNIIVLTGAGVSTSSGIPDFRSRDGIYARLHQDFPDLPDPQAMFDISYFKKDPRPFFKFSKEIYPGQFQPAIGHYFIKCLEKHEILLRNYTQNIDTLEQVACIQRVINCHGSFASATCTNCKYQVDASIIKDDIFEQRIPKCPRCPEDSEDLAVMKPDIVFFGEGLPDTFHDAIGRDKDECDLLIVIGSSMKVRPVALIPSSIPDKVPQILINREPLGHLVFDIELLGDCDEIIQEICLRLGEDWAEICTPGAEKLSEITELPTKSEVDSIIPAKDDTQAMETSYQNEDNEIPSSFTLGEALRSNDEPSKTSDRAMTLSIADNVEKSRINDTRLICKDTSTANDDDDAILTTESEGDGLGSAVAEAASPAGSPDLSSNDGYDSAASQLPPSSYLYVAPSRYIFKGAEINIQTLENYRRKHSHLDETVSDDKHQPTVPKHIAHIRTDSSTFSSVGSSIANSSSDSSSSPDCSSMDRSPVNVSQINQLKETLEDSSPDKSILMTCENGQDDTGMLTKTSDKHSTQKFVNL